METMTLSFTLMFLLFATAASSSSKVPMTTPATPPHSPPPPLLMSLTHSDSLNVNQSHKKDSLYPTTIDYDYRWPIEPDPNGDYKFPGSYNRTTTKYFYTVVRAGLPGLVPRNLVVDIGTSLLWLYCERPYQPQDSSSYKPVACDLNGACSIADNSSVVSTCGDENMCGYLQSYDGNTNEGSLGNETFAWGINEKLFEPEWSNVTFGCAKHDVELLDDWRAEGVMGLGPEGLSFVRQNEFSMLGHCIGNISKFMNSHQLTMGVNLEIYSPIVSETPLMIRDGKYTSVLKNITSGGVGLVDDPAIFSAGMSMETALSISFLPESVVKRLEDLTAQAMTIPKNNSLVHKGYSRMYRRLCYNGKMYENFNSFPEVNLIFEGDSVMSLGPGNLFEQYSADLFCLGVLPAQVENGKIIMGNIMMQFYYMVYDISGGKLSFGRQCCSATAECFPSLVD